MLPNNKFRRVQVKWRSWLIRYTPSAMMEYPFEVFIAIYGLLASLMVLFLADLATPEGMREILPPLVIKFWAGALFIAAVTLAVGLNKAYRLALPIGLRLLSILLTIFALAAAWLEPSWEVLPGVVLVLLIASLAGARSTFLREAAEVRRMTRVSKER